MTELGKSGAFDESDSGSEADAEMDARIAEMDAHIAALQRQADEAKKKPEAKGEPKKALAADETTKDREAEREQRAKMPEVPEKQQDPWDLPVDKASTLGALSYAAMLSGGLTCGYATTATPAQAPAQTLWLTCGSAATATSAHTPATPFATPAGALLGASPLVLMEKVLEQQQHMVEQQHTIIQLQQDGAKSRETVCKFHGAKQLEDNGALQTEIAALQQRVADQQAQIQAAAEATAAAAAAPAAKRSSESPAVKTPIINLGPRFELLPSPIARVTTPGALHDESSAFPDSLMQRQHATNTSLVGSDAYALLVCNPDKTLVNLRTLGVAQQWPHPKLSSKKNRVDQGAAYAGWISCTIMVASKLKLLHVTYGFPHLCECVPDTDTESFRLQARGCCCGLPVGRQDDE